MAQDMETWNAWARGKSSPQAVMMTSEPIAKYRDFVERRALLHVLIRELAKNAKILEVGCGNGRWMGRLLNLGYSDIFGFDFSRELVAMAEKKMGNRFSVMDMYNIGLRNGVFDVALLLQVIPHGNADKLESVMFGVDRLLKGRAKIILMDEFPEKDIKDLSLILSKKGFRLKKIKNVRSEIFNRLLSPLVKRRITTDSEDTSGTVGYAKTSVKHYFKIAIESIVDILLSPFFENTDLFLEKILVFEK